MSPDGLQIGIHISLQTAQACRQARHLALSLETSPTLVGKHTVWDFVELLLLLLMREREREREREIERERERERERWGDSGGI
jgi:hypothetical protein